MAQRPPIAVLWLIAALTGAGGVAVLYALSRGDEVTRSRVEAQRLASRGDLPGARQVLEQCLSRHPDDVSLPRALATLYKREGDTVGAQRILEKSLKQHPADAATNELLADMVVESLGDLAYRQVEPLYEAALRSEPQRGGSALALAKIYVAGNRPDDAVAVLQKALGFNPRDAAAHLQLAAILTAQRKFNDAGPHFDSGTALDPGNAEAFCAWGKMLVDAGKPQKAKIVLRRALEINDASAAAHMQLGRALRDDGEFAAGMKEFERALGHDNRNAAIYLEIADTFLSVRDPSGKVASEANAEIFLRDAVRVDSHNAQAKIALARLLTSAVDPQQRNPWQAAKLLQQAVDDTHEQDPSVLVGYADALERVELYDQAVEQLDKAIALGRSRGLSAGENELLWRFRQKCVLNALPAPPPQVLNVNFAAVEGLRLYDPMDQPWPEPARPALAPLLASPLDISRPPAKGSALDPEILTPASSAADRNVRRPPTGGIPSPENPR